LIAVPRGEPPLGIVSHERIPASRRDDLIAKGGELLLDAIAVKSGIGGRPVPDLPINNHVQLPGLLPLRRLLSFTE
jgi:hypothetical protein